MTTTDSPPLDPAQAAAATGKATVQLTLAGPGSGKTTTLAGRFVHLVRQGAEPRRLLAVTFTRKAADEMGRRISGLLRLPSARGLPVMTFHAFAFRHLRANPAAAGLPEGFQLWEGHQQRHVFHARQMWWNEEMDILDIIGGAKERMIDAAAFARMVEEKKDDLPESYAKAVPYYSFYEAALRQAGAIDFSDMVPLLARAMARDESYRRAVTGAFDHLLVDEYQDVNPGQLALIDHFVAERVHLWAVGDDDQTLFSFRASDIRHILDFGERHAGAEVHILDRNYRSAPDIVTAAKTLIRRNRLRADKDYGAVLTEPGEIVVRGYSTPEVEARQVTAAIAELLGGGLQPRQIAVLYRAGTVGLPLQTAMKESGIPFEVRGSGDLWQSTAARLVVGALHYLRDGQSVAAMSRLGTGKRSSNITERLDEVRSAVGRDFQVACRQVKRIVGGALPRKAAERERNEWASLVESVIGLAAACSGLDDLERRIADQSAALRNPPQHAVVLSTVHSAKGLEWDAVFLVGLEEGVLPSGNADDLEEERRVAYVGITRARRLLGLTHAAERYGTKAQPSRFLAEIRRAECHVESGSGARDADLRLPLASPEERRRLRAPRPAVTHFEDSPPDPAPPRQRNGRAPRTRAADPEERRRQRMERNIAAGQPACYGLPWLPEEEVTLRRLFDAYSPLDDITRTLQRKGGGVLTRLVQLGLLPPDLPTAGEAFEARLRAGGPETES
ncbi:MAG: ATP-dependent helicase [Alphaproteobacteria bacterium]